MEEYDKKLEGIKSVQSLKQKELDAIEQAEKERLRREKEDEKSNMYDGSDGRQNENDGSYHNSEGEELMLLKSSSLMNDEDEENNGPDPLDEEESMLFDLFNCTQPWQPVEEGEGEGYVIKGGLLGWNESVEVNQWFGVTCGKPITVKQMRATRLASQQSSGGGSFMEMPPEAEEEAEEEENEGGEDVKYTKRGFVRRIYLDRMFLDGGRLPQMGWNKLNSIKILSLSHNQLSGDIPIELGLCRTLQVLNLSCNKVGGGCVRGL
jgi:Leucine-rich repeat (LRR) protein